MKKLKIFLLLCLLICFGFALTSEVHAQGIGPKVFEVGDILPPGQIKISWDFSDINFDDDGYIRIRGTNDFNINVIVNRGINDVIICIMGTCYDIIKGNIVISLDSICEITEFKSDGNNIHILTSIQGALFWEFIGDYQEGYEDGYTSAREYYGYYDSTTDEWLSVEEYLELYGTDKPGPTDFYNNFDKYFIPAMIIVFGGAIVLTILKVFKGRE